MRSFTQMQFTIQSYKVKGWSGRIKKQRPSTHDIYFYDYALSKYCLISMVPINLLTVVFT